MAFVFIYLFVSVEAVIGQILHTDYTVIFVFSCNPLNYSSNCNLLLALFNLNSEHSEQCVHYHQCFSITGVYF